MIKFPWWHAIFNEILTCSVIVPVLSFGVAKIINYDYYTAERKNHGKAGLRERTQGRQAWNSV